MANLLLPPEERNLTPDQVEALDKRRDLGHAFLVIAGQFAVIATILLLWVGQDLTYSPGWAHPIGLTGEPPIKFERMREHSLGAKARGRFAVFAARLKPCPFKTASFSAACKARVLSEQRLV